MRRLLKTRQWLLLLFFCLLIANISVFAVKYNVIKDKPLNYQNEKISIIVDDGDTLYGVLEDLQKDELLRSAFFSKMYLKFNNISPDIKSGEYEIDSDIQLKDLIKILSEGELAKKVTVTFPEGYTIDDIGTKLEECGVCEKQNFLEGVKNYNLPGYIKHDSRKKYDLEGYLFPDTYEFKARQNVENIISKMIERFEEVMKELERENNVSLKEEDYEKYVNVASIIEKEAITDKNRVNLSSLIYNRIKKNMYLEIPATVSYGMDIHKEILKSEDLELDSTYNTYKNLGLPVGPISNPGKSALKAAIKPAQTDYLYYMMIKDSNYYFTNNYEAFQNKKKELER